MLLYYKQGLGLTGANFEDRGSKPSPNIGESFGKVVGESPLFKR